MSRWYTYDENHKPVVIPDDEFPAGLMWLTNERKRVASTKHGDVRVSTVFLGLDHGFEGGPPVLWETMIFGGEHHDYQDRYTSWEDAEVGHETACAIAFGM